MLVASPIQKQKDKVPDNKINKNFVNNKSNDNRKKTNSFYSFDSKNNTYPLPINNDNQILQKPFNSNVHLTKRLKTPEEVEKYFPGFLAFID